MYVCRSTRCTYWFHWNTFIHTNAFSHRQRASTMSDSDFSPEEPSNEDPSNEEINSEEDSMDDLPLTEFKKKMAKKRTFIELGHGGDAPREDSFLLPSLPPGEKWEWKPPPGKRLVVMKDAALAATNAVAKVWPKADVVVSTCAVHACNRWLDTAGRTHLKQPKQWKDKMIQDFEIFKNCPYIGLVDIVREAMVSKWTKRYKEGAAAKAWNAFYSGHIMTRIQLNHNNPLKSGFPSDNNTIEVGNKDDKDFLDRKRASTVNFLQYFGTRVQYAAQSDLKYCGRFKNKVHSGLFFEEVEEARTRLREKKPCFLNLRFPFSNKRMGLPQGSYIFATDSTLEQIEDLCKSNKMEPPTTVEDVRKWLIDESWVDQYKAISQMDVKKLDPGIEKGYSCRLNMFRDFFKSFHVMSPVDLTNPDVVTAVQELLGMLAEHDLRPISFRELIKKPIAKGYFICNCARYLHYGWCVHTCSTAFENGVIRKYPQYLNPTKIATRSAGGQRKAIGGKALSKK